MARASLLLPSSPLLGRWDDPPQAARLAALLYGAGSIGAAGTLPLIQDVDRPAVLVTCGLAFLTAVVLPLLPWARWPRWTTIVPVPWAFILLGVGFGVYGGALTHYLSFYGLAFLYTGLTQRPGVSLALAPPAAASVLVALLSTNGQTAGAGAGVDAAIAVGVAVLIGEVLASATAWQRRARTSVDALLQAASRLIEAATVREASDLVAALACELLGADAAFVALSVDQQPNRLEARGSQGVPDGGEPVTLDISAEQSGLGIAFRSGRSLFVPDAPASPILSQRLVADLDVASTVFLPIAVGSGRIGAVAVWWHTPRTRIDEFAQSSVEVLATQAGQVLERLRTTERLAVETRTDPLTALANRRAFLTAMSNLPVGGGVVFLDLDHFKRLNDSRGHAAGDQVLRSFATCLSAVTRDDTDVAARYGGEEFAVVLPTGGAAGAERLLRRLRHRWSQCGAPVTFSAGIAERRPSEAPAETLARADAALYAAKGAGRDRTVTDGDRFTEPHRDANLEPHLEPRPQRIVVNLDERRPRANGG
ncbi:MAG: sensor domain-containing diguanylate cyclase [Mycobacteriales bacterium]